MNFSGSSLHRYGTSIEDVSAPGLTREIASVLESYSKDTDQLEKTLKHLAMAQFRSAGEASVMMVTYFIENYDEVEKSFLRDEIGLSRAERRMNKKGTAGRRAKAAAMKSTLVQQLAKTEKDFFERQDDEPLSYWQDRFYKTFSSLDLPPDFLSDILRVLREDFATMLETRNFYANPADYRLVRVSDEKAPNSQPKDMAPSIRIGTMGLVGTMVSKILTMHEERDELEERRDELEGAIRHAMSVMQSERDDTRKLIRQITDIQEDMRKNSERHARLQEQHRLTLEENAQLKAAEKERSAVSVGQVVPSEATTGAHGVPARDKDFLDALSQLDEYRKLLGASQTSLHRETEKNAKLLESVTALKVGLSLDGSSFLRACEAAPQTCTLDDCLEYANRARLSRTESALVVETVVQYLEWFLGNVAKGASSGTNRNGKADGVGGGKISNNFVNPIVNFIKSAARDLPPAHAVDLLANIDWKKLLEEYTSGEVAKATTKRDRIFAAVYNAISVRKSVPRPIFGALNDLAKVFEGMSAGDMDLGRLSDNIRSSLQHDGTLRSLRAVIEGRAR